MFIESLFVVFPGAEYWVEEALESSFALLKKQRTPH